MNYWALMGFLIGVVDALTDDSGWGKFGGFIAGFNLVLLLQSL